MATYRKRNGKWRVEIYCNGIRKSSTWTSKADAREWAEREERAIRRGIHDSNYTLQDALDRYRDEVTPTHKGAKWERTRLKMIGAHDIALEPLSRLTAAHVATYRDIRLERVSAGSVNRELNVLSAVINTARKEWGWCSHNPVADIRRPKNPPPRNRRITDAEVDLICAHIVNQDVKDMFLLALETAMRISEMCNITAADIHADYVTLRNTKNGDTRHVPLTSRAKELVREFDIEPGVVSVLFRRAVLSAGLSDLTFHDSRHEATFRLAQKITNPLSLAKITGHRDLRILLNVYYSPTPADLAALLD